jgi:hypothetical protein
MAWERGATSPPQQFQVCVQQLGGLYDPVGLDSSGHELDRKRYAVKPLADLGDHGSIRIAELAMTRATNNWTAG